MNLCCSFFVSFTSNCVITFGPVLLCIASKKVKMVVVRWEYYCARCHVLIWHFSIAASLHSMLLNESCERWDYKLDMILIADRSWIEQKGPGFVWSIRMCSCVRVCVLFSSCIWSLIVSVRVWFNQLNILSFILEYDHKQWGLKNV